MWRLVLEKIATVAEIEDGWSLEDVLDANEALDVYGDANDPKLVPPDEPGGGGRVKIVVRTSKGPKR